MATYQNFASLLRQSFREEQESRCATYQLMGFMETVEEPSLRSGERKLAARNNERERQ